MEDAHPELSEPAAAAAVAKAIDAIAADILRNHANYSKFIQDVPRIATAMERSIKKGNIADARMRATQIEKHIEEYAPTEEPAREAKFTLRHRLRLLTQPAP